MRKKYSCLSRDSRTRSLSKLLRFNLVGRLMEKRGNFRVVCISQEYPDDPYVFDLYINGAKAGRDRWFFGYYGVVGKDMYPFVLYKDGRIDFGSTLPSRERYGFSNILDIDIELGSKLLIQETSTGSRKPSDYMYRVASINDLDPMRRHEFV